MNLKISFKHMHHTPALDQRIQEKSQKFEKYFQGQLKVDWHCWVHGDEHWAEVKVHGPKFDFFAKASADNLYKSLDLVVDKMERQMDKQKHLKRDKLHQDAYSSPKYNEMKKQIYEEEQVSFEDWEEKTA
jgi:putative sigma-54 modulation protein